MNTLFRVRYRLHFCLAAICHCLRFNVRVFQPGFCSTNQFSNTCIPNLSKVWNVFPEEIVLDIAVGKFKAIINTFLLF